MKKNDIKRYLQFALIVLAAGSIFPIIYLRTAYSTTIISVFNLEQKGFGGWYSILGIIFAISYFPSGLLCIKFSPKWLIVLSLIGAGTFGVWFAQIPSYNVVMFIYVMWGIFSVFTFWGAHMSLTELLSKPNEKGKFYGILDGGRGVVEAVLATIAAGIFQVILNKNNISITEVKAFQAVVYVYVSVIALMAILITVFLQSNKKIMLLHNNTEDYQIKIVDKFTSKDFKNIIKNKYIWLISMIIFFSYIMTYAIYYMGESLEVKSGFSVVNSANIMVIILWMRPIGGLFGGWLADRYNKVLVLIIFLISAALCSGIAIILTGNKNYFIVVLLVISSIFIYAIRGSYWSLLGQAKLETKSIAVGIGIISFIGYMPDIFLGYIDTGMRMNLKPNVFLNGFMILCIVSAIVAIPLLILYGYWTKKDGSYIKKENDINNQ